MKATLLIKNIEYLYTCDRNFTIFSRAFIAFHHNMIIDLGTHSYKHWLDSATRVIDASGEIVVPGFIDANYKSFSHVRLGDQLRENHSALFAMQQNGILTLLTNDHHSQQQTLSQDVIYSKTKVQVPMISTGHQYGEIRPKSFLLSCGFGHPNSYVYSMQPCAHLLFTQYNVDERTLLEAMTSKPASLFGLKDRGALEIGKIGDVLVLQVPSIAHYFQTLGRPLIHRMIKNGIPFYPEWIVC